MDLSTMTTVPVFLDMPPAPILLRGLAAAFRQRADEIDRLLDGPEGEVMPAVETMGGSLTCPRCGTGVRCLTCEEAPDGDG